MRCPEQAQGGVTISSQNEQDRRVKGMNKKVKVAVVGLGFGAELKTFSRSRSWMRFT